MRRPEGRQSRRRGVPRRLASIDGLSGWIESSPKQQSRRGIASGVRRDRVDVGVVLDEELARRRVPLTTTQVYTHVARTYVNATASPLDRLKEKKQEPDKE